MLKLFSITFLILLNSFYVSSLKSEDICIKTVKYDGNYYGLSNCNGTLNYDCSKFECARNAFLCEEYQQMIKYMDQRKSVVKQKTTATTRGISFVVAKTLRKYEYINNHIEKCL
jgi:hypothetical protein